jgi:putative transposase
MGFGYAEGVTHDYHRHGTTTLFAALDLLDGSVLAQCRQRQPEAGLLTAHPRRDDLAFLERADREVLIGIKPLAPREERLGEDRCI